MSVYTRKNSPFYYYEFQIDGHRFHGSTRARNKKEALSVEKAIKTKAHADMAQMRLTGDGPLTLDLAAGRYWLEKGQTLAAAEDIERDLARLIRYFGPDKLMSEISDADVAALVAWRRSQTLKLRKKDKSGNAVRAVSAATVNRSTTGVLRQLFTRAKRVWRFQFPKEPHWNSALAKRTD